MQVKKDTIRDNIVAVAHKEFLQHGVKKTSMRVIAKASGVALGNIYKYFKSKDELLRTILSPLINALDQYMAYNNSCDSFTVDFFEAEALQNEMMQRLMHIIKTYRQELRLLFFDTAETSLADYRRWLTDQQMQRSMEYLQIVRQRFPHRTIEVSPFLMRVCSAMWVTVITEIVADDSLDDEAIAQVLAEYIKFGAAGWQKVMKID